MSKKLLLALLSLAISWGIATGARAESSFVTGSAKIQVSGEGQGRSSVSAVPVANKVETGTNEKVAPVWGQFTITPDSAGNCPGAYINGRDERGQPACLKPTIESGADGGQKIILGSGQVSIEDLASTKKAVSEAAGGFQATVNVVSATQAEEKQVKVEMADETGNKLIKEGEQTVPTSAQIEISGDQIKLGDGSQELTVLPTEAATQAAAALGGAVGGGELKVTGDQWSYVYTKTETQKLLGLIPVTVPRQAAVSVSDATKVKLSQPWWSFLAF